MIPRRRTCWGGSRRSSWTSRTSSTDAPRGTTSTRGSPSSSSSITTAATTLPPDESNGNNPVSRYKVATDGWRSSMTSPPDRRRPYAETRDLVATLLPTGKPADTRDLAAQTIGLCLIDERQVRRPDSGQCPAPARPPARRTATGRSSSTRTTPITEMQTGESLCLALAGLPPDHPAVKKGVLALLLARKSSAAGSTWAPTSNFELRSARPNGP